MTEWLRMMERLYGANPFLNAGLYAGLGWVSGCAMALLGYTIWVLAKSKSRFKAGYLVLMMLWAISVVYGLGLWVHATFSYDRGSNFLSYLLFIITSISAVLIFPKTQSK